MRTESDFIHHYLTTMQTVDIHMDDDVPETNTDGVDGMYIFYGLGGILIFFVIYVFLYNYFLHCKAVVERQEMELRELTERASRTLYRPPMNARRIISDDTDQTSCKSIAIPALSEGTERERELLNLRTLERLEDTQTQVYLQEFPSHYPQELLEGKYFPEDIRSPNATSSEVAKNSGAPSETAENPCTVGRIESWMSEQPLCFSTPVDSNERIFFPEDFQDLLFPNSAQMQKNESSTDHKFDNNAIPLKDIAQPPPIIPGGKSLSSPSSPEFIRRRLKLKDATRRPFSWR